MSQFLDVLNKPTQHNVQLQLSRLLFPTCFSTALAAAAAVVAVVTVQPRCQSVCEWCGAALAPGDTIRDQSRIGSYSCRPQQVTGPVWLQPADLSQGQGRRRRRRRGERMSQPLVNLHLLPLLTVTAVR